MKYFTIQRIPDAVHPLSIGQEVGVLLDDEVKWRGHVVGTYTEVHNIGRPTGEFRQGYLVRPDSGGFWLNASDSNKAIVGFTSVVPCNLDSLVSIEKEED